MGNTVSASNYTDVPTIESILSESCENIESLGNTRFMKVAKARGENGYFKVYKMFIKQDKNLKLDKFQRTVSQIGKTLRKESNCLPVRVILNKDKEECTLLLRSYQKYTLFDRLSTRPFINDQERIWYIYQLFKALDQCHKANVCHGDLKSQNVLLSSANWLQITDFASFKPTFIHHDNPSFFTYFFDTSRRDTCYLAPERFLSSVEYENNLRDKGEPWLFDFLTPQMDMFSAGCVVYEILCEGKVPFTYGEICKYRNMDARRAQEFLENTLLRDIADQFKPLLRLLFNREPSMRVSAQSVLDGTLYRFPQVLEWYYKYVEDFRPREIFDEPFNNDGEPYLFGCASHDPDNVISLLVRDEENIFEHLNDNEESRSYSVLVISLITSNIRSLKGAQAKVDAIRLLVKLSFLCDCTIALERILPYFVYMLADQHVTVRVFSIHSIVDLIKPLEPTSIEQSSVFMDYLLPEFTEMLEKRNKPLYVTQTLAANLGFIAQCAYKFYTVGWGLRSNQDDECSAAENLDQVKSRKDELDSLEQAIKNLFTSLSVSDNIVRHCLINPSSLAALFKFFHAIDSKENFLIQHMLTFLNSKVDWRLRTAVFDTLPICLQKKTIDVRAILQQGLHDFEELVVIHVLHCIHSLIASDLLEKHAVVDLLKDISPFLAHPNEWIRSFVVNVFVLLDSKWSLADIHSKLLGELKDFLKCKLLRLNSKVVIMRNLKEPIPRNLWKLLMEWNEDQMKLFCIYLAKKELEVVEIKESWFKKIGRIEDDDLMKLKKFQEHLVKMIVFKKSGGMEVELTMRKGKVDLTVHPKEMRNEYEYGKLQAPISSIETGCSLNDEWNEMFSESTSGDRLSSSQQLPHSTCGATLQRLLSHKENLYLKGKGAHPNISSFTEVRSTIPNIRGTMLTHLHEHTGKITKIAVSPEHQRIVTVSLDGYMKIWNERTIIGEGCLVVKSDATYSPAQRVALKCGAWMNRGHHFVVASAKGEVTILDLTDPEKNVSKVVLPDEDGAVEEIHADNNILFVRSHHGVIYCLDRRIAKSSGPLKRHEVWRRVISDAHGLIAASCIDPWKANWMVLSTTNSKMLLWDLRYQQEVREWKNNKEAGVPIKLWSNHCSSYSDPQIFVSFNKMGDVGIFDVARASKTRILWSSLHHPLTYKMENGDCADNVVTSALCVNDTGEVFTGDSLGAIRKWNLKKPHYSEYLSGNRKFQGNHQYKIAYEDVIVKDVGEEVPVIREVRSSSSVDKVGLPTPAAMDIKGTTSHRTSITDIACLNRDYLITGSFDGVVKIWK